MQHLVTFYNKLTKLEYYQPQKNIQAIVLKQNNNIVTLFHKCID